MSLLVANVDTLCNRQLVTVLGLAVLLLCSALSVDVASQMSRWHLELRESFRCKRNLLGAKFELAPLGLVTSLVASHHMHKMLCSRYCPWCSIGIGFSLRSVLQSFLCSGGPGSPCLE